MLYNCDCTFAFVKSDLRVLYCICFLNGEIEITMVVFQCIRGIFYCFVFGLTLPPSNSVGYYENVMFCAARQYFCLRKKIMRVRLYTKIINFNSYLFFAL